MMNPLADALAARRFSYVVELVATGLRREAQLLEVASRLATLPDVVAGSITSYAGGAMGHDPLRVGTAARARGLAPNIHLTCVNGDRQALRKTLEDLHALGIQNVFALTGDFPKAQVDRRGVGAGLAEAAFDLDSVQLVRLIAEMRRAGMPFHVAVAVSPFKYVEADCMYQYLKLEKKIAAGADLAITQVGWDAKKFAELRRYLTERTIDTPVLGNVYVLGPKAAERMATGQPPGCWVSPALLETVRREAAAKDGGLRARLERAARTVAVLRGLGYAGAYIGGTHDAGNVAWIIRRSEELAPRWEALAEELHFGDPAGFYVYDQHAAGSRSAPPRSSAGERLVPAAPRRGGAPASGNARHVVAPPAQRALYVGGQAARGGGRRRASRAGGEEADVRLPGLRQLRARPHGVCLPADLPQADAQWSVRRHLLRALRGRRPALHLGKRVGPREGRRSGRSAQGLCPPARPLVVRDQLLDQLLPRARQPAFIEPAVIRRRPHP